MNHPDRENRVASVGEMTTRMLAGRARLAAATAAAYDPTPTREEMAAFNRHHAHNQHIRLTPARYATAVADHPQVQDWAECWLADMHAAPWLLLVGDVGTGKTHQAYGALRHIANSGYPVVNWRSITAADLYARMRPGGNSNPETTFAELAAAPILLLDDLGATRLSEFTEEITYRLVDHRYNAGTATIITSNVVPEQFLDRFGKRTNSRLRQMCMLVDLGLVDRRAAPGAAA